MRNMKRIAVLGLIVMIAAAAALAERPGDGQQDMDLFFKAKELVFKRDWDKARTGLESYLKDFPAGRMRDEALYWLAQSLDQMSREEKGREAVVRLKKAAVDHLRTLIVTYPASLWKEDAATLRVEIAGTLALLGEDGYKSVIDEAARASGKSGLDIKLSAVAALADLDPKTALPVLRRELASEPDTEVRLRAVRLLARFPAEDALPLLGEVVQKDMDERVRSEASSLVRLFERRQSPVRLSYFIYGCRLLDEGLDTVLPEKEVREFLLDRSAQGAARALLAKARKAIGGEVSSPVSSANGTLPLSVDFSMSSRIVHRAGDYNIWINERTLDLSAAQIRGEIEFRHRETGEVFTRRFSVDPAHDKLLVVRTGANLSLLLFQFAGEEAAAEAPVIFVPADDPSRFYLDEKAKPEVAPRAEYGPLETPARIALTHGIEVRTEKTDYALDDFDKNLIDLEQAKAEIPAGAGRKAGGAWTLVGDLFYFKQQEKLVGFGSVLINPDGGVAAEGLIEVPAGDPAGFKVLCGRAYEKVRRVAAPLDELRTRPIYPTMFASHLGWEVLTTRNSTDSAAKTEATDFGLARAVRSHNGREWILIGELVSFRTARTFQARRAALIASDGTIVCGDELRVPADNPEGRTIVRKGP